MPPTISSRAVRVARTLVLLSTGCSSAGTSAPADIATDDAAESVDVASPETAIADSSSDTPSDTVTHADAIAHADAVAEAGAADTRVHVPLTCEEDEYTVTCSAGKVCAVSVTDGIVRCIDPAGGILKACGELSCGWMCACSDPAKSICQCYSDAGPLPPPDLPLV